LTRDLKSAIVSIHTEQIKQQKHTNMRTKTLALSALLGMLGSASVMAQSTNVYSINAVGYINVTLYPGYNIVTCPLIASPDNTLNTLLNNTNGQYQVGTGRFITGASVFQYINGVGYVAGDQGKSTSTPGGWISGGTNTINPGQAIWFLNPQTPGPGSSNMYATFVGTVPQSNNYNMTNTLYGTANSTAGYNLVGSMIPMSGDLVTNAISDIGVAASPSGGTLTNGPANGDNIYVYDPTYDASVSGQGGYLTSTNGTFSVPRHGAGSWTAGGSVPDPAIPTVYTGFWYQSATNINNAWVENFTINP
jgi:hypothetical protein